MMSDTRQLLGARASALKNRARLGRESGILALTLLAGLAISVFLGWLAMESLLGSAESTVTPQFGERGPIAGSSALEAAFWLTALISSLSSFRVMELLFRREDIRVVALLPLSARAFFWDRTLAAIWEALAFGLFLSAFFLPLMIHGHGLIALVCMALSVLGSASTALLTMAVVMWMGSQFGSANSGMPGDAYGGQGGAFIYAPGAALGLSVVNLLILQLALREVLAAGDLTRAAQLGGGIALGLVVLAVLTTYRAMSSGYHEAAAFFHEAESIGFELPIDYQLSAMKIVLFGERFLSAGAGLLYRRDVLQGSRRNTLVRYLYAFVLLALTIALWRYDEGAVPTWVAALCPALLFAIVNPWRRLSIEGSGASHSTYLPVSRRDESGAQALYVLRETLLVGLVALVLVLVFRGEGVVLGALALLNLLALAGTMSWLTGLGAPSPLVSFAPLLVALVLAGLTLWNPLIALIGAILLSLLHILRPSAEPIRLEVS